MILHSLEWFSKNFYFLIPPVVANGSKQSFSLLFNSRVHCFVSTVYGKCLTVRKQSISIYEWVRNQINSWWGKGKRKRINTLIPRMGTVVRSFVPNTWEAETNRSVWAWGQSGLHNKFKVNQGYIVKLCLKQANSKTAVIGSVAGGGGGVSFGRNSPRPQLPSRVLLWKPLGNEHHSHKITAAKAREAT